MAPVKKKRPALRRHYLREWREHRELTQERAAERLDMSRTQLSKIESGKQPYSQALLEAAADAYRCSPADLIMRNPLDDTAPWSIMDTLQKAAPDQRAMALAVLNTMLKTGT